ncbi:MAG: membrane protein insertase YidC [Proteobacteria bacterium]|nr:membrane protein insertase YidC [Pseudomonadota bacterium]
MKTEHRALIAVALSAAFFVLWYTVISPPKKAETPGQGAAAVQQEEAQPQAQPEAAKVPEQAAKGALDPQAKIPPATIVLRNDLVEVEITNDGGAATSWRLKGYNQGTEKDSPLIDLAASEGKRRAPLSLSIEGTGFAIPGSPRYEVVSQSEAEAVLRWRSPGEISITKKIALDQGSYVAGVDVEIKNESDRPFSARPSLSWGGVNLPQEKRGFLSFMQPPQTDVKQPAYYSDGKVHREKNAEETVSVPGSLYWSGLESRYFISAVVPRVRGEGMAAFYGAGKVEGAKAGTMELWAGATLPSIPLPAGQTANAAFSVYSGPKDIKDLKAMGVGLEKAIDYGWFSVIAVPILYLLKFFHSLIGNYGVAIILLTICVKLLLHPINVKSLKSMKAMQQLQPRLKELQARFKDDKQKLNAETMQLFRAHKVNPMGGCLPMILQLPIYIALYKVLWSSIELYHAPFFWFYRDLSAPDPYFITPILLGIFMFAQQQLTPSASADPTQKKMMMFMPIMFTMFMLFLPVGLVVYILVNTVMSVTQQWMYNRGIGFMDLVRGRVKLKAASA